MKNDTEKLNDSKKKPSWRKYILAAIVLLLTIFKKPKIGQIFIRKPLQRYYNQKAPYLPVF